MFTTAVLRRRRTNETPTVASSTDTNPPPVVPMLTRKRRVTTPDVPGSNAFTPPFTGAGAMLDRTAKPNIVAPAPSINPVGFLEAPPASLERLFRNSTGAEAPMPPPPPPNVAMPSEIPMLVRQRKVMTDAPSGNVSASSPFPLPMPDRNRTTLEQDEQRLADLTTTPAKNKNSRWNVREALGNAFESIAAASARGADWKQALAAGAGRVAGGFINPAAGEQRAQNREVALLERRVGSARQREAQRWDGLYRRSRAENEAMEPERAARDAQLKASQGERELIVKLYNEVDEFDPDSPDPRTQEVVARAEAAGVPLMKKTRRDRTTMQATPDGRVFLHDGSGNVREATDPKTGQPFNVARPGPLKLDTLTDDVFGLPSDKQIEDMARSRVPQAAKTRRIRPEVEKMFSNQDGQFDQQALDDAIRLKQVSISDAYENVDPPGIEQALARERERIRSTTAPKRQMVADFRLRLGNMRPNPTGEAMPVGVLTEKFRQILALPPKQQQEQLKQFYAALPLLNLQ